MTTSSLSGRHPEIYNDPLVRARQLLVDVTDNRITGVKSVDAGSLGGGAKCGEFTSSGIRFGACAWVDEASIGVLIFYGSDADKAAAELADTRAQIEKVA